MKKIIQIALLFFSLGAFAQGLPTPQPSQKEIVDQVWKPFIESFNNLNTDGFMAIHSKEVVRAMRDDGRVMGYDEYLKVTSAGNQSAQSNKTQRKLELRFTEHWVNQDLAYEAGVYKSQMIKPSGNNLTFYGKFNVVLRKESGVWKILVDSDSSDGGNVSANDFLAARPME